MYFLVDLTDDGVPHDERPNDGTYTGSIHLEEVYRQLLKRGLRLKGIWRVYAFAQDVNDASPDMEPHVAATHIGGFVVASGVQVTFDRTLPCPVKPHATVLVVA